MDEFEAPVAVAGERPVALTLGLYLGFVVLAEAVAAYGGGPEDVVLGMAVHVVLVFALLAHAGLLAEADEGLSRFLGALALVPLIRVLSLALPFAPFTIIEWLLLISFPLLAAAGTLMWVQGIQPREVGLRLGDARGLALQGAVALSGVPLGVLEFFILRPTDPWIPVLALVPLVYGAVVVGVSSGVAEELIFRGLLQREAEGLLGAGPGVLYVAVLFAAMHIGFQNLVDLGFVFGVGLYFGYVMWRTRSLLGIIFAHGLANVMLYLVLPFHL